MRIAVDAMGGDFAPAEIVAGAVEASGLLDKDDELILIGPAGCGTGTIICSQVQRQQYPDRRCP